MVQVVLPRVPADDHLRIGAAIVAWKGFANVGEPEGWRRECFRGESLIFCWFIRYSPVLPGKDSAVGRRGIATAFRIDQKLGVAHIPVDRVQVPRIALPVAERDARVVDKQLMAPVEDREELLGKYMKNMVIKKADFPDYFWSFFFNVTFSNLLGE